MPRSRLVGALLLVGGIVLVGCTKADDTAAPSGCAETIREASQAVEAADQVRLLDMGLVRCRSMQEFTGEMAQYPGIIGYSLPTFVQLRCVTTTDEAVRNSPACDSVAATVATTAPAAPSDVVFRSTTLDGRTIEIRPDDDTPFVGQYPAAVQQNVDTYLEGGCVGVIDRRDFWAAQANDPTLGDEASVYAQHAQQVADYVGCVYDPITPPTETAEPSTAPSSE